MALANKNILHASSLSTKFQTFIFDEETNTMEINSLMSHGVNDYQKSMVEDEDGSQSTNGLSNDSASASATTHSPTLCGSSTKGYVYNNTSYQLDEEESLINFKGNEYYSNLVMQGSESLLSFQQSWMVSNDNNLQEWNHVSPKSTTNLCMVEGLSNLETSSGCYGSIFKEKQSGESSCGWLYSEPNVPCDDHSLINESATHESISVFKKRSSMVIHP